MDSMIKIENISLPVVADDMLSGREELDNIFREVIGRFPSVKNNMLILPQPDNSNYKTSLYGTGNPYIISRDGHITAPLEDMTINLFYRVTDTISGQSIDSDTAVVIKICADNKGGNKKPKVLPCIREWHGADGEFELSGGLVYNSGELLEAVEQVRFYITEMTGYKICIKTDNEGGGNIIVKLNKALNVGDEGYTIDISDQVIVCAASIRGIIYAGATLAQILMQSSDGRHMPKGMIRDYPQYTFRSCMLDTARYYMSIDYLEEVSKYAGFFKLNHIHLHLNDGAGETDTSFRLESEKYPELNREIIEKCIDGKNKLYIKEDFIKYQRSILKYGIEVVPEIDSPSHCGSICMASNSEEARQNGFENVALNSWQLDLRGDRPDKAASFVQSVIEEYTDKNTPVFKGQYIHIGTDEWLRDTELETYGLTASERNECMRKYMDIMIKYIDSIGYQPVLWSGLNSGSNKYAGKTPVSDKAVFQIWSLGFADIKLHLKEKYCFINSNDADLYIVPGVDYYKTDLDIKEMYDNWYTGKFGEEVSVDEGHPLLLGAETALWLDASCACSDIDIFRLLKNQIVLMSEKTWYGDKSERQSSEEYVSRVGLLANYVPGANPERYIEADQEGTIIRYDFKGQVNSLIKDLSGSNRNAWLHDLSVDNGVCLDGKGWISSPVETVPNPFTFEMRCNIFRETARNAIMFESTDGRVYFNYESTGKIAFERKGYTYIFHKVIPWNTDILLRISVDKSCAYLGVDDEPMCKAELVKSEYEIAPKDFRTLCTFAFPVKRMFPGIKGKVYSLTYKR